jgi:hypothetical protein
MPHSMVGVMHPAQWVSIRVSLLVKQKKNCWEKEKVRKLNYIALGPWHISPHITWS